jgi:hypothetical protein
MTLVLPAWDVERFRRPVLHGLILGAAILSLGILIGLGEKRGTFGWDAAAYWSVNPADPYAGWYDVAGSFRYSPVMALVAAPLRLIPLPLFLWAWVVVGALAAVYASGRLWVLALPFVVLDLFVGNVHLLLAAAIIAGFRWPAAWAFVVFAKATCGIGLLWFAARGEWRKLAIALGTIGAIGVVSLALVPDLWAQYLSLTLGDSRVGTWGIGIPVWFRLPIAAAVVIWGARTDRFWTVPLAAYLALPVIWPTISLALLVACLRPQVRGTNARYAVLRLPQ